MFWHSAACMSYSARVFCVQRSTASQPATGQNKNQVCDNVIFNQITPWADSVTGWLGIFWTQGSLLGLMSLYRHCKWWVTQTTLKKNYPFTWVMWVATYSHTQCVWQMFLFFSCVYLALKTWKIVGVMWFVCRPLTVFSSFSKASRASS